MHCVNQIYRDCFYYDFIFKQLINHRRERKVHGRTKEQQCILLFSIEGEHYAELGCIINAHTSTRKGHLSATHHVRIIKNISVCRPPSQRRANEVHSSPEQLPITSEEDEGGHESMVEEWQWPSSSDERSTTAAAVVNRLQRQHRPPMQDVIMESQQEDDDDEFASVHDQ